MHISFFTGGALALAAAVSVLLGEALGLELTHVTLLGLGLGAAVALVPDATLLRRLAAFAVGVVVAWLGYAVRAAMLPDSDLGRAVDFALVVLAVTLVAGLSFGRLPLWSQLLGVAAVAGAYETTYTANPPLFASESVVAVTSVVLTAVIGVLVASLGAPAAQPTAAADRALEDVR